MLSMGALCLTLKPMKLSQLVIIKLKALSHLILKNVPYVPYKYTIHAEQDCINKCPKSLISKCSMVLVKVTKNDIVKPCEKCAKLIKKYKIKRVYCFPCNE